jgi:hypothetical protein
MSFLRLTLVVSLLFGSLPSSAREIKTTIVPGANVSAAVAAPHALPSLPATAITAAAQASSLQAPHAVAAPEGAAAPAARALSVLEGIAAPEASSDSSEAYDGSELRRGETDSTPFLEPAFEPPTFRGAPPHLPPSKGRGGDGSGGGKGDKGDEPEGRRIALSFSPAAVPSLMAIDKDKALYAAVKRVRGFQASKEYWAQYKKGAEVDIMTRGENRLQRPTTITYAGNKKIKDLTREDLEGVFTKEQLKAPYASLRKRANEFTKKTMRAPIQQLRQIIIDQLEENRRAFQPNDPQVSPDTTVRVIRFKPYIDLYRETHGADSVPPVEPAKPRSPLIVKPEGKLANLPLVLPKAVYLDVDELTEAATPELLSDMMKLQRTGVYFIAFSRLPYSAPGGMRDKLIRKMSAYQLSILLQIRFLAVTDDGAVISAFPKGGSVVPVDVAAFSDAEMDMLRDAAHKAAEHAGLSPKALREVTQPPVKEAVDEFPGLTRRKTQAPRDPHVRYEISFPKTVDQKARLAWAQAFNVAVKRAGLSVRPAVAGANGVAVQKTDLGSSLPRVAAAIGEQFGLYLDPGDIAVLSADPALRAANPSFDLARMTGLKGAALVENALGLMLGEHRENVEGDLSGSASRMAQFTRDRVRYLSDFLIKQDGMEQNINFFSGHVIHAANDWLVWNLKNGRRPTRAQFEAHIRERWEKGIREFKPVGLPPNETMEGWLDSRVEGALNMYEMVLAAKDRGEIIIGTEVPNFFIVKDYQRRSRDLKRRYILHTIFDFVVLRPNPAKPGHADLVIYDFKTGPAQSRQKLDKDVQVQTYALMAHQRWVGKKFPTPYLSGDDGYVIDSAKLEFIYNAIKQPTTVTPRDLDTIYHKIIRVLNGIRKGELQMLGQAPKPKAKKK